MSQALIGTAATRRMHGGAVDAGVLDFSANLNPLGPPDSLTAALAPQHALRYPEPGSATLCRALAEQHGIDPDSVLVTNGACEAIELVMATLTPRRVVVLAPAFTEYEDAARAWGHEVVTLAGREEDDFRWPLDQLDLGPDDLLVLGNPASPSGVLSAVPEFDCTLLVDETYMDFVNADVSIADGHPSSALQGPKVVSQGRKPLELRMAHLRLSPERAAETGAPPGLDGVSALGNQGLTPLANDLAPLRGEEPVIRPASVIGRPRTLVVRSFTKLFACPGLRLGYLIGDVAELRARQPAWSVSRLAQSAGLAMLAETDYQEFTRRFVRARREELTVQLKSIVGIKVFPSAANFLLLRVAGARRVAQRLLERGIAVRLCDSFTGLEADAFLRVAVRKRSENERLVEALAEAVDAAR